MRFAGICVFLTFSQFIGAAPAMATDDELPSCEDGLRPVWMPSEGLEPPPEDVSDILPGTMYMHAAMVGNVTLEFTVKPSGEVESPSVVESSAWSLRYQRQYEGYFDESALKWALGIRYPAREASCRNKLKIKYEYDGPEVGKSVHIPSPTYKCVRTSEHACVVPEPIVTEKPDAGDQVPAIR